MHASVRSCARDCSHMRALMRVRMCTRLCNGMCAYQGLKRHIHLATGDSLIVPCVVPTAWNTPVPFRYLDATCSLPRDRVVRKCGQWR